MLIDAMFPNHLDMVRELDRRLDPMHLTKMHVDSPGMAHGHSTRPITPALNMWERDDAFVVEMEIPGCQADDLDVSIIDDILAISGTLRRSFEDATVHLVRRERPHGSFQRRVKLTAPVDVDQVDANLDNGVLTINLPKSDSARPRRVEVQMLPSSD